MKRVFSALIAGAMVAAMAVPAFAAEAAMSSVYNADGDVISVKDSGDVYGNVTTRLNYLDDISIDGVLPGISIYIPLGASMDEKFDTTVSITAADIAAQMGDDAVKTAVTALAQDAKVLNSAGTGVVSVAENGVAPTGAYVDGSSCYVITEDTAKKIGDAKTALEANDEVSLTKLTDKDLFKFDYDKDDGSKYVSKIELISDKKLGDLTRSAYLKVTLAESQTTSDLKSTGTITFKAKKSAADADITSEDWTANQKYEIDYNFWINNSKVSGSDGSTGTGDRVYFDPDDNEDNTLIWGDDRAAVYFEANDDANKFYARLQTKTDSEIYATYGDPVNADLWFFDFVGNPTVPSTARATLTLGIPWDEDDDYTPNAEDCFIYEKDADGNLVDVTSKFTYDEDNDGTTEIPGWTIKTRTLGTYIISDTELDTTIIDDVEEEEVEDDTDATVDGGKEIPNTGSSDMVGVAVVAAVVSLAAAGAVAFKKASK